MQRTLPLIMRTIGEKMDNEELSLSPSQKHTLMILSHHEGVSLSFISERLGVGLPATSKLVDDLVNRGLVTRKTVPDDRRRICLTLTDSGKAHIDEFHRKVAEILREKMECISENDCLVILHSMELLQSIFTPMNIAEQNNSTNGRLQE